MSLRLLYGFFIIEYGRRHVVHFNATYYPTAAWVIQQLREAYPYDPWPNYLIFDRDSILGDAVVGFIKAMGTLFAQIFAPVNREIPAGRLVGFAPLLDRVDLNPLRINIDEGQGTWLFVDNDSFLGVTREQRPVGAAEIHLVRRFKPGFWALLGWPLHHRR